MRPLIHATKICCWKRVIRSVQGLDRWLNLLFAAHTGATAQPTVILFMFLAMQGLPAEASRAACMGGSRRKYLQEPR